MIDFVSDGVTEPIQMLVPINIEPVDDAIEFLSESFTVELEEDVSKSINLENYTVNVDDDLLTFNYRRITDLIIPFAGNELLVPALNQHVQDVHVECN